MDTVIAMVVTIWTTVPPPAREIMTSAFLTFIAAFAGRMAWHVRKVQHRERKFFSTHLWFELVTAVCCGWVADGIATYAELTGKPAIALIVVLSYLGPSGIEHAFWKLADKWPGSPQK